MTLQHAHKGYEYQDLLVSYFILRELIRDTDCTFHVDQKQFAKDSFDDLTIKTSRYIFKKQIKYSDSKASRKLQKKDFSTASYQLALDDLFFSWNSYPDKSKCEITLCLRWSKPADQIKYLLKKIKNHSSFDFYASSVYQIDIDKFWPKRGTPPKSWKKFNRSSIKINRSDFEVFLKRLFIELELPDFSLDISNPNQLELIVLDQIDKLGIGYFPNNHLTKEHFALSLISSVKRARSTGSIITKNSIFKESRIQTNYGSISQKFIINKSQNIPQISFIKVIHSKLTTCDKLIISGEPGGGKSWLAENLRIYIARKQINVIRHLCYTDLNDPFQKERILLNVFYGNLINDILKHYPSLGDFKEKKFASTLDELNNLLSKINKETYLIIDGLDHIERIYEFKNYSKDVTRNDIAIVDAITKLTTSTFVKIILISQPISELDNLKDFERLSIPPWKLKDIQCYLDKLKLTNSQLDNGETLSNSLLKKSLGNPLYLKYLTSEIAKTPHLKSLKIFPDYNNNLTEYYNYILSTTNINLSVPRILSGVNFTLSIGEIKQITGGNKDVEESLKIMSPVVKLNATNNGYSIYHESFRRFILEKLKADGISHDKNIFDPIIRWFEEMGFYNYKKSYSYYVPYLYDLGKTQKLKSLITNKFVTDSVFYGHSWDSIKSNYKYFAKVCSEGHDLPLIVLVNELNKTIASTETEFFDSYLLYLDTLGSVWGFEKVIDHIVHEDKPTVSPLFGIKVCYLCDLNGVSAPWYLYQNHDFKNDELLPENFKYFIKTLIVKRDFKSILNVYKKIINNNHYEYISEFLKELERNSSDRQVEDLIKSIRALGRKFKPVIKNESQLLNLLDEILALKHISEADAHRVHLLSHTLSVMILSPKFLKEVKSKLLNKSWFSNWIYYLFEKSSLLRKSKVTAIEIENVLSILTFELDPFKGTLKTSSLLQIERLIFNSIGELLNRYSSDTWDKVFQILYKVSDKTLTSYRKALMGPLTTPLYFKLIFEYRSKIKYKELNHHFAKILVEKEDYQLHGYLAEYCFIISRLHSENSKTKPAQEMFSKAIQFLLGYTSRKDDTISDLIESIPVINKISNSEALKYTLKLNPLVDSVVNHTDGKGTYHFPMLWFRKFLQVDKIKAEQFLVDRFKDVTYNYRLEENLQRLLEMLQGKVNPFVEMLISRTYIIANDEWFLNACLDQLLQLPANKVTSWFAIRTFQNATSKTKSEYSTEFIEKISSVNSKYNLNLNSGEINVRRIYEEKEEPSNRPEGFNEADLALYDGPNLASFISRYSLSKGEIDVLRKRIQAITSLDSDSCTIIEAFFSKNHRYKRSYPEDELFKDKNDLVSAYYWNLRYLNEIDPWFNPLTNTEALKTGYAINKDSTLSNIFTGISERFLIQSSSSFSSNLLKGLHEIQYDTKLILKAFKIIFDAIEYKLPQVEKLDWKKVFERTSDLNESELLICLLILRLKSNATDRILLTLAGINEMININPDLCVKPIKWFLKNHTIFKKIHLTYILHLLDQNSTTRNYAVINFTAELDAIYPQNYLLIDVLIEKLLHKKKRKVLEGNTNVIYPTKEDQVRRIIKWDYRLQKLENLGFNVRDLVSKLIITFDPKLDEEDVRDLYYNRVKKLVLLNIYQGDYLMELINTELYSQIYSEIDTNDIIKILGINLNLLIAQTNSFTIRPVDLVLPNEMDQDEIIEDITEREWIRIAHFEGQEAKTTNYELKSVTSYGSISFQSPYSTLTMLMCEIETDDIIKTKKFEGEDLVHFQYKYDGIEPYRFLWLNPKLNQMLKIETTFNEGIRGCNENDECVLKCELWNAEYVAETINNSLFDEIPTQRGCQLLIRRDYYESLCRLFSEKPKYMIKKFH